MRLPPLALRRTVVDPVFVPVALAGAVLAAVGAVLALVTAVVDRRVRTSRVAALASVYLVAEVVVLVAAFGLWLARPVLRRPVRRWEAAHFALARAVLVVLVGAARRVAGFRIEVHEPPPGSFGEPDSPVLVLSRHAGAGDSFTLMYLLLVRYGRTPRVVLTARLQLDPAIDVLLHRIDGCFVGADGADPAAVTRINGLASRLVDRDVMVIFPEGANFSEPRRHRLIRRLREAGHRERAAVAEEFVHVLPPRPAGVLAALEAGTCIATVIVAHTGLDRLTSTAAVWAAIPLAAPLEFRWWWEPTEQLPQSGEGRLEWLTLHWAVVDAWISSRHAAPAEQSAPAGEAAEADGRTARFRNGERP